MKSWPTIKIFVFKHLPTGTIVHIRAGVAAAALAADKNFKYLATRTAFVIETEKLLPIKTKYAQYPRQTKRQNGRLDAIGFCFLWTAITCALLSA